MLGLHAKTHTLFIKGDLGLFSMRKHRQIQLIKFWLKILQCPSSRLIRAAYDELLTQGQKSSWPFHVKKLLDSTGLSYAWNGGEGPISDQKAFLSETQIRLEDQEIQKWWNDLNQSESLSSYYKVKENYGEELYFKLGIPKESLKSWMQVRANCLPLHSIWKNRCHPEMRYTCPICGDLDGLDHFLFRCQGLNELRRSFLGVDSREPLLGTLKSTSKINIVAVANFVRKGLVIRKSIVT